MDRAPEQLTAETFEPLVGTTFLASGPRADLLLVNIETHDRQQGQTRTPFTLTFTSQTRLPQSTYELEHAELGNVAMFLVPRQPLTDGLARYDAVFN